MIERTLIRRGGLLVALGFVAACTVPKLSELGPRRCDDQHPCVAGYTCVLGTCEPETGSGVPGGPGDDGGAGAPDGSVSPDGGDGGGEGACSPGAQEACDPGPGCGSGTRVCGEDRRFGPCVSGLAGSPELCNGVDDNCDGITDALPDGGALVESSCALTRGVCAGAVRTCVGGAFAACDYGPQYEAFEHACDGVDNDCDGRVDISKDVALVNATIQEFDAALSDEGGRVVYVKGFNPSEVTFQRFGPEGSFLGQPKRVASATFAALPSIAVNGTETAVAFTLNDSSFVARLDAVGNHLLTEGGGTPHAVLIESGAPTRALKVAYSGDRQSLIVFRMEELGVYASRYTLDGALISSRTIIGNSGAETFTSLDVVPRSTGGFLLAVTATDSSVGWTGAVATTVSDTLVPGSPVGKDGAGAPTSVRLFQDPQSSSGVSLAWMSKEETGNQDLVLWFTRKPLSDTSEVVWNTDFGFRTGRLVAGIGAAAGPTWLVASPDSSNSFLYRVHGPPATPSFSQGQLDGFTAKDYRALWSPLENAWFISSLTSGGLRLSRVCGP